MAEKDAHKGLFEQLKRGEGWAQTITGLISALTGLYVLVSGKSQPVLFSIGGITAVALWLMLFKVYRKKCPSLIQGGNEQYEYAKRKRMGALVGLVVVPILTSGIIYRIVYPPPPLPAPRLKCPPMTVAIAGFEPLTQIAENLRLNLYQQLADREADGNHVTKDVGADSLVTGSTEADKERSAIALGKSNQGQAHVVVWGRLLGSSPIRVKVNVTRVHDCAIRVISGDPTPVEPETFSFEEIESQSEADIGAKIGKIARFVTGLCRYKQGDTQGALDVLRTVASASASLYEGLIFWDLAHQSEPVSNLNKALKAYQQILGEGWDVNPDERIQADAYVNAGNAFLQLSHYDRTRAGQLVEAAFSFYERALAFYSGLSPADQYHKSAKKLWAGAKNNLTLAKIRLADIRGPTQRSDWLREAEKDLDEVLRACPRDQYEFEWAAARFNLGSLWFETSEMDVNRKDKLAKAEGAFLDVVTTIDKERAPYDWAVLQGNLGDVCTELAKNASGDDVSAYLKKAKEYYDGALHVLTQESYPLDWAEAQSELGLLLIEQARTLDTEEALPLLQEAVDRTDRAVGVYRRDAEPQDWAFAVNNLAHAKNELGTRSIDDAERVRLFHASEQHSREVLRTMTDSPFSVHFALAKRNLGDSLYQLGVSLRRPDHLREATDAYRAAFRVWDRNGSYHNRLEIQNALTKVQQALTQIQ